MTPTHQKLIDQLLQSADHRARELLTGSGYQLGREARIEELRKSPLGQHLANLANYSEGYAVAGDIRDIRGSAQYVSRFFYGEPFHRTSYKLPVKFHETDLGNLVNEAVLRFYQEERPGQLLTMEEMRQLFGVSRQAVHQWIRKGEIFPVWVKNTTRFYRKDVDRLIENQQKKKKKRGT
jgi:excisionase family DNA binding protein